MSNIIGLIVKNASQIAPELGMYEALVVDAKPQSVTLRSNAVKYTDVVAKLSEKFGPPTEQSQFLFIRTTQWRFEGKGLATVIGRPAKGGVHLVLATA